MTKISLEKYNYPIHRNFPNVNPGQEFKIKNISPKNPTASMPS
jgi:hypothetical protein